MCGGVNFKNLRNEWHPSKRKMGKPEGLNSNNSIRWESEIKYYILMALLGMFAFIKPKLGVDTPSSLSPNDIFL
jgi:hypothetical protein